MISVTQAGSKRVRRGHPWIYRSDVTITGAAPVGGDLVSVRLPNGRPAGIAVYSDCSQITLRFIPLRELPKPESETSTILDLFDRAIARRVSRPDACRWINGDADGLPGLIVDRYGPAVSIQCLSQFAARRQSLFVEHLRTRHGARLIVARNDVRVRDLEGLPREKGVVFAEADAPDPRAVRVKILGLELDYDLIEGQKTGGFLDQTDNREAARLWAKGETLDCFSYDGGFALPLSAAGCLVTAVDSSGPALDRLRQRAAHNGLTLETLEENVFDLVRVYEREGRTFDTIVLDPPAFAKSRTAVEAGRRAYKEINLRALKLLRRDGILITCSCSAHMERHSFESMVAEAAADAQRFVRIVERRSAAPDHPSLVTAPETDYLKVLIAQVH